MVVTDLDGTLSHPNGGYTDANRSALNGLGRDGYLRVVATGRSLFFARKYIPGDFPVDYVVFSSGAGIVDWATQNVIVKHHLPAPQVSSIRRRLVEAGHDFMIHDPIPENHRFAFWHSGNDNPDFLLRCERQAAHGRVLTEKCAFDSATQFLVVVPGEEASQAHETLRQELADCSVIRATSPLDKRSAWLEIFGKQVSKSQGAAWLGKKHGITAQATLAVGNDYNDIDLLQWAGTARVVADSPNELRASFTAVAPHDESGFAQAVHEWLQLR